MPQHSVLLVDDAENVVKALVRLFQSEGYHLHTAASADDAIRIMNQTAIDLLITDECMPGLQGTELLRITRELSPHTIRFMLTGIDDIKVAQKAVNSGEIARFFTKPWDDFELLLAVRQALEKRGLERENCQLKNVVRSQNETLAKLEREHPGISNVRYADDGAIVIDANDD